MISAAGLVGAVHPHAGVFIKFYFRVVCFQDKMKFRKSEKMEQHLQLSVCGREKGRGRGSLFWLVLAGSHKKE